MIVAQNRLQERVYLKDWLLENVEGLYEMGDYLSIFLLIYLYAGFDQQCYPALKPFYQALKESPDAPFFLTRFLEKKLSLYGVIKLNVQ